ncbi:RAD52 motif-containing protein 1 [Cololabis saira]|uniref:RAD52 motif-containing protein 1 n=1 Tax=Cololabis saira TaxID=129043 RepID=UPI002AD54B7D|nr:RAD52 motif-containing protein 1 [Cololabis saira]
MRVCRCVNGVYPSGAEVSSTSNRERRPAKLQPKTCGFNAAAQAASRQFGLRCPAVMDVDILEFRVPVENNKTVFVWDIQPGLTEAQVHAHLFSIYSAFGPLYLLKVTPNLPPHPGFSALLKFYSAAQAAEAQRRTDGRRLFQDTPLKVKLSSKQTPHFMSGRATPLNHARCLELANHCLGFSGWTSRIVTLKELDHEEEEEEDQDQVQRRLRFGCLVQLDFPHHGLQTRGAAVVEDCFTCTGPDVVLQRRCRLQRSVREKALVQAFNKVLLVLLGDGKVMVELKQNPDQFEADEEEQVLQVNALVLTESAADEEEADEGHWDLTVS